MARIARTVVDEYALPTCFALAQETGKAGCECAFRVVEVAGGFQLMSRPQFSPWLRRLHSVPLEVRLSGPALETLAVVAYRQPMLRVAVGAIRPYRRGFHEPPPGRFLHAD